MKKDTQTIINDLIDINDYIWDKYGYTSRPSGYEFIELVLNIADHIAYRGLIEDITPEVQDMLTNENMHTLNHAIEVVRKLHKYA